MSTARKLNNGFSSAGRSFDPHDIVGERSFQKLVVRERKRSERSGDSFALVCVGVAALQDDAGRLDPVVRESLFSSLLCLFRETDIVGWYREDHTMAVLLTELGENSREEVRATILAKLDRCMECQVPREISSQVSVTVHYYPEDQVEELLSEDVRQTLYPDLSRPARRSSIVLKRALDIAGSLGLIVCLSPLLLLIALAIKLTSRGPVLFRQERLGQFGRKFQFLKFRSMHVNSDSSVHEHYIQEYIKQGKSSESGLGGKPIFKLVADPRVTPVGRFLRKTSLDELPQFFNVLKGEMSLVGPRPPIPYEIRQYDLWHRRRILEVKPGITGIWQVYGRSRTTFDEMVRMDLQYARNWSLWMDLRLLLQTPMAVLRGDGAV